MKRPPGDGDVRTIHAIGFEDVATAFEPLDARIAPLDGGDADVSIFGVSAGGCTVLRQPVRGALFAEGCVDQGRVGLLQVSHNEGGGRYNGEVLPSGSAVLYGQGAVHTGAGRGAREIRALTVPLDVYRSNLSALLQADPPEPDGGRLSLDLDPPAERVLGALLRAPERALGSQGDPVQAGRVLHEETLPRICALLAKALAASAHPPSSISSSHSLFHAAREHIHANYHQPLQMVDLCRALSVSAESLRLAFQQYVQMPPMRYLRTIRLARCRERLRACDPRAENVKTVARNCGIRELGRFAGAYRQRYGRLPSEDLRRP